MAGILARLRGDRPQALGAGDLSEQVARFFLGGGTASGMAVGADSAMRVSTYFACVNVLAQDIAKLPLILYRRLPDGGRERATDHHAYRLLHRRPNGWQTAFRFRSTAQAHLGMRGNTFALKTRVRGQVRELLPVGPDRMRAELGNDWHLRYWLDGKEIDPESVFHVRGLSLDGVTGVSVATYARETLGLALATEAHGARLFSNGALFRGILKHPQKLRDENVAKRLRESFDAAFSGANAHKTALLEEGMQWERVAMTAEDSQFLETREFQAYEVARWFRMPPHKVGLMKQATFCLPAGELVYTVNGPVPIEEVTPGTTIWSRGDNGLQLAAVKHAVRSGCDPIITIRTTNRTLRCNARHPVLCRRKAYAPVAPGELGGANIGGEKKRVRWVTEYVPAGELAEGDTIVTLDRLPDAGSAEACPTRRPTIGFMEFCGLLLGDGNVIRSRNAAYVSIARASSAAYMDYYREVMRSEFVSFGKKRNGIAREGAPTQPVRLQEGARQTRFSSVLAVEELEALGLTGNARTKRVPAWVFGMPEEHRLAFLRGFLDADGSVDKKGRIAFHSVNERMLQQIRHLCIGCGIPVTNIRNQVGTTTLPNGDAVEYDVWSFTCSDPGANRRIGSRDPRYVTRLESGKPFERKGRNYPRHGGRDFDEPGLSLARISGIEVGGAEDVYDLEVEGTHSFIASGVVVHNSNIEHQSLEYVQDTLLSWLINWEQEASRALLSEDEQEEYFFEHLVDGMLRGDQPARYRAYKDAVLTGFMSRNEVRAKENLNPVDGLDEYLVPLNMAPTDDAETDDE